MPKLPAAPTASELLPRSSDDASFAAPAAARPWFRRAIGLALVASVGASGCLSDRYRIPDEELKRQVELRPEQRGQNLKVVQSIGSRQGDAVPYGAPPPAYGGPPGGYAPGYATSSQSHVGVFVGMDLTPGPTYYSSPGPTGSAAGAANAGRPSYAAGPSAAGANTAATGATGGAVAGPSRAAPGGAAGAPAGGAAAPAGGGSASGFRSGTPSGGSSSGKTSGKGNSSNDAAALAVLAVVVAATAVITAAATEGARYDGTVNVTPYQNVYLRDDRGGQRVQALGDLSPTDLLGVSEAYVSDAEGYGMQRLGRHPLNRRGFTFKLDVGSLSTRVEQSELGGAGANIQFGYFLNKKLGLLATAALTGGDAGGARGYVRSSLGGEVQGFLPGLGPLHVGGFGNVAFTATEVDDAGSASGTLFGVGGIAELELTTRLALMFRVGYSWSNVAGGVISGSGGWNGEGLGITGGLAIY